LATTCSAKLVDLALASGKIYEGEGFKYIQQSFETGTLHLIGLLSDGGVHSRIDQLQVKHDCFSLNRVYHSDAVDNALALAVASERC
jgi:bisphosphoglycerate-independent phosphoglycerate mutase (AlkP superfamily)